MNNNDIVRELIKIEDVLFMVKHHLNMKDEMNAALHMASETRHTPLYSAVANAHGACMSLRHGLGEKSSVMGIAGAGEEVDIDLDGGRDEPMPHE